jgi:hypothetical protein
MPTLAATSAIGFIVAARAISMSDLMVTGLVPPAKASYWRRLSPHPSGRLIFPAPILSVHARRASLDF